MDRLADQPEQLGSLAVPDHRAFGATDFQVQPVLPAGVHLHHVENAPGAAVEMKQDRSVVFGHDLRRLGRLLTPGAGKRLCATDRLLALGVKGREIGIHLLDVQSRDELGKIHPVGANV